MTITDKSIFPIGMGTGNVEFKQGIDYTNLLELGLEQGANFIDTAESYLDGNSERMIGKAIKDFDREKIIISSKVSPANLKYANVLRSCHDSLKRLDTDYIDIYYIHWPNPSIPLEETLDALRYLLDDGKIRHIGLSNFNMPQILDVYSVFGDSLGAIQMEYNVLERGAEDVIIPFCKAAGILFVAHTPLCQGTFKDLNGTVDALANKYNRTHSQILLRWIIRHKNVIPIPKSTNAEHFYENLDSTSFKMHDSEYDEINYNYYSPPISYFPCDIICGSTGGAEKRTGYTTIEEAVRNDLNFIPSPVDLARELLLTPKLLKPIQIRFNKQNAELVSGNLRYWAWVIAFGSTEPIECLVVD